MLKADFLRFLPGYKQSFETIVRSVETSKGEYRLIPIAQQALQSDAGVFSIVGEYRRRLEEHKVTFREDNVKDILDMFLVEMQKKERQTVLAVRSIHSLVGLQPSKPLK